MYTELKYLYPPRPELSVPKELLPYYESKRYLAQYKKNGTCVVIFISPDKKITFMTRHGSPIKQWTPSEGIVNSFSTINRVGWNVLVGELLHCRTKNIKDTIYLFDALVIDGEYLVDKTFEQRYDGLINCFDYTNVESYSHMVQTENLWIAKNFDKDHLLRFKSIKSQEDEGLVLKDPKSILKKCLKKTSNTHGQVKCRITN